MKTSILILAVALITIFTNKAVSQVDKDGYSFHSDTLNGKPVLYYQKILPGNPVITVDSIIQRSFTIVDSVTYITVDKKGNTVPQYRQLTVLSVEVDSTHKEFIGNNPLPAVTGTFTHKYIVVDENPY
jgi:hypothetical protein